MKKLIRIAAVISALVLIPVLPAFADDFVPRGVDEATGSTAFVIEDRVDGDPATSAIIDQAHVPITQQNMPKCHDLDQDTCRLDTEAQTQVEAILPLCGDVLENCIESVKIYRAGEAAVSAKYLKNVAGFTFPSNPKLGNQRGSTPSVWDAPGAVNLGGSTKYVVTPRLIYGYRNGQIRISDFQANVIPIVEKTDPRYKPMSLEKGLDNGTTFSNFENGDFSPTHSCVATDVGWCGYKTDFSEGTRVELNLMLVNKVTGWLHGRLKNPEIQVTVKDSNYNSVSIGAEPVTIPIMYSEISKVDQPEDVYRTVIESAWGGHHGPVAAWHSIKSEDPRARFLISKVAKTANDTAAATSTSWQVKSIQAGNDQTGCLTDANRLIGLVTTNSMAYAGGAPAFTDNKLSYEVAGLHFMPDGKTPVEGTYDLAIRGDVARCLYGFSKAPISATINVTGAGGETKTATTVVNEKDGWLKLAAYGFTFSSPTISVKLTQAKAPAKKTTITCVKGKLSKKVTAVGPKCPAGYKKK
jgi:hypothetical protein